MADFIELRMTGGDTFLTSLATWRDSLKAAAQADASATAARIVARTLARYPLGPVRKGIRPGNLRKGVRVDKRSGMEGDRLWALARSGAPHSHLFEWGTTSRKYGNHATGSMPANPVFVPIAVQERAGFVQRLTALVARPVTEDSVSTIHTTGWL